MGTDAIVAEVGGSVAPIGNAEVGDTREKI